MHNLIDGKEVAAQVGAEVAERVRALEERTGVRCGLATILVGDDPASHVYVASKHQTQAIFRSLVGADPLRMVSVEGNMCSRDLPEPSVLALPPCARQRQPSHSPVRRH